MAATAVASAATKIPWKQILIYLPDVVKAAKGIWKQWDSKPKAAPIDPTASTTAQISAIAKRIQALEENEENQSKVISEIAEQMEGLAAGLREIATRQILIFRLCIGSIALASCALLVSAFA